MAVLQTTWFKLLKPHRSARAHELLCDIVGTTASSWCLWCGVSTTTVALEMCVHFVKCMLCDESTTARHDQNWHYASVDRLVLRAHPVFMCIVIIITGTLVEVQSVVHKTGAARPEISTQLTAECAIGRGHSSEQQRPQCMDEMVQELGVDWRTTEFDVTSRGHRLRGTVATMPSCVSTSRGRANG